MRPMHDGIRWKNGVTGRSKLSESKPPLYPSPLLQRIPHSTRGASAATEESRICVAVAPCSEARAARAQETHSLAMCNAVNRRLQRVNASLPRIVRAQLGYGDHAASCGYHRAQARGLHRHDCVTPAQHLIEVNLTVCHQSLEGQDSGQMKSPVGIVRTPPKRKCQGS